MDSLLSLLLFAGLFFVMMRFGCGSHVMHGGHGHQHGEPTGGGQGGAPDDLVYACPMHPEIRQTYPGTCPKCGMTLEQSAREGGKSS